MRGYTKLKRGSRKILVDAKFPSLSQTSISRCSRIMLLLVHLVFSRIVENDLFKQDWRSRNKVQIFQYVVLKWTLVLLIGLGTGVVGFFNNLTVENIVGFKLLLTSNIMLEHKEGRTDGAHWFIYSQLTWSRWFRKIPSKGIINTKGSKRDKKLLVAVEATTVAMVPSLPSGKPA